jgi:hypothetical protein
VVFVEIQAQAEMRREVIADTQTDIRTVAKAFLLMVINLKSLPVLPKAKASH